MDYPQNIQNLIKKFSQLPSIGPKTAERIVIFLLSKNNSIFDEFSKSLLDIKGKIKKCSLCNNYSETDPCSICANSKRDKSILCIVAKPQDVYAIEKTNNYTGCYFVLGGNVNPLEGITLESLNAKPLFKRLQSNSISEVILAFNPDIEGETTILALQKHIKLLNIKITRLARGLPMGSDIEYADEVTLTDALKGRKIL